MGAGGKELEQNIKERWIELYLNSEAGACQRNGLDSPDLFFTRILYRLGRSEHADWRPFVDYTVIVGIFVMFLLISAKNITFT